ncbi:MAG: hypothetical protein JNL10_22300, partial [Verrucomicrobiales bacterium]|nr:hypothetical protein [Verrucomicrobiales bacterium]
RSSAAADARALEAYLAKPRHRSPSTGTGPPHWGAEEASPAGGSLQPPIQGGGGAALRAVLKSVRSSAAADARALEAHLAKPRHRSPSTGTGPPHWGAEEASPAGGSLQPPIGGGAALRAVLESVRSSAAADARVLDARLARSVTGAHP